MSPTSPTARRAGGALALALVLAGCGGVVPGVPATDPAATTATTSAAPTTTAPTTTPATTAAAPTTTAVRTPAPPTAAGPRPGNGQVIVRVGGRGPGQLDVENGTPDDGYVTLARDGRARIAFYVRAKATARITGVADGTYQLFFSTGTAWNTGLRAFTADADVQRFDDTFRFRTTRTTSTRWTVTLHAVRGGRAATTPVPAGSVPR